MKKYLKIIAPYIAIALISLVSIYPSVVNFTNGIVDDYDGLLITWILNQSAQKLPFNISEIFNTNIFYPHENTLAFSDMLVPSALIAKIGVFFTLEPLAAFNTVLLTGQILTGWVVYYWWKKLTNNGYAAFIATLVLILSQIRMHYAHHLQMWSMQWFLLSLFFVWSYRSQRKVRSLYFAALFLTVQIWESLLPVMFIMGGSLILLWGVRHELFKHKIKLFFTAAVVFIMSFPVFASYLEVYREFQIARSIREAANFSMSLNDLWGVFFVPGMIVLLTAGMLLNRSIVKHKDIKWLSLYGLLGFIMALGPVLKWGGSTLKIWGNIFIPLPYVFFYYFFPGSGAFRTPSRWIWLVAFALSGVIAVSLAKIDYSKYKILAVLLLFIVIVTGAGTRDVRIVSRKAEYPAVYKWLKDQNEDVIIELPIYKWGMAYPEKIEVYRMLYSLEHEKKLVNGYSGFFPPYTVELVEDLNSKDFINILESIHFDYAVVNKNLISDQQRETLIEHFSIVYRDSEYEVYTR